MKQTIPLYVQRFFPITHIVMEKLLVTRLLASCAPKHCSFHLRVVKQCYISEKPFLCWEFIHGFRHSRYRKCLVVHMWCILLTL